MERRSTRLVLLAVLGIVALASVACGGTVSAAQNAAATVAPTTAPSGTEVPVTATPVFPTAPTGGQAVSSTSSNQPTTDLGVTGMGQVFGDPDTAIATVGVEATETTLAAASADAAKRMTSLLDKLKALGVDAKDIKTVSYNVNPITSSQKEGQPPAITGYQVVNQVQIKIRKIDQVGTILDGAMAAGANTMYGLYFTIDNPTALSQQARAKAVADAMAKAQVLAEAAKVKLGPIISISENVATPRPVYTRAALPAAMDSAAGGIGPVAAGQNEIDVTVEIHWQIVQ